MGKKKEGRAQWSAQLPVDLINALETLRFAGENRAELSNRLILQLIDWIKRDRLGAIAQGVLVVDFADLKHPEMLEFCLEPALEHTVGAPSTDFPVVEDSRAFCYANTRIIVPGKLPERRKLWQFRALEPVDQFVDGLKTWDVHETRSRKLEIALRWACQVPQEEPWADAGQFFAWLRRTYDVVPVPLGKVLDEVPVRASRTQLLEWLDKLEFEGRIRLTTSVEKHLWVKVGDRDVQMLQVTPGDLVSVAAYELRDAFFQVGHTAYRHAVLPALRGNWVEVRFRRHAIALLVGGEAGESLVSPERTLDLEELSQPEFFSQYKQLITDIRHRAIDGARLRTGKGDLYLISPAKK